MTSTPKADSGRSYRRSGQALTSLLLAVGLFGVVLGFVFFSARSVDETVSQAVSENYVEQDEQGVQSASSDRVSSTDVAQQGTPETVASGQELVVEDEAEVSVVEPETANDAVTDSVETELSAAETRALVAAHLEVGEFSSATNVALGVRDVALQTELLGQIAQAQWDSGEFQGVLAQVRRDPIEQSVAQRPQTASNSAADSVSLAGGAGGADFTQLMDLIMNQTNGPWMDLDGTGGSQSPFGDTTGGISVDPSGVMQHLQRQDRTQRLAAIGWQARRADLNADMSRPSELRLVSLTRLEAQIAERLAAGQPALETMKHLAGLTSVKFVFVLPETGEIVIGGPAEGWSYNELGVPVGETSGRPTLQLDDLVAVLRVFSADGARIFTCSIDPRPEGIQDLTEFVQRTNGSAVSPAAMRQRTRQFEKLLGLQNVTIKGVPQHSRIARLMAEADYRMKLIGIDKLDPGVSIPSYFDLLDKNSASLPNSMDALRWWLTMKYDAVLFSADRDVFELQGSSVLCLSENEFVNGKGERVSSGDSEETNRAFARSFTEHYAELAQHDTVFADLQNVFDLALVAALIDRERLDSQVDWNRGVFASDGAFEITRHAAPQMVNSVVNYRVYNGQDVVVQVAGGVRGDLLTVLGDSEVMRPGTRLESVREQGAAVNVPTNRWWWDAR